MGREVVRAVAAAEDMLLVGAVDRSHQGEDAGTLAGVGEVGVAIEGDLAEAIAARLPEVMVDFTLPDSAPGNIEAALRRGVSPVVGTTGLGAPELERIGALCAETGVPALVAPNFAVGAVLMMEFAARAARHLPDVEIIELHHDRKLDSPSGTAMLTAARIAAARRRPTARQPSGAVEKAPGARGAQADGVHIHSVRLPGLVAHQEVIFGGPGQTLTLRHDSLDRASFMPGVLLGIRRVRELSGLVVGLESLLD
jgi:4-hydroxy-tetrahydrodipicolinate reductase